MCVHSVYIKVADHPCESRRLCLKSGTSPFSTREWNPASAHFCLHPETTWAICNITKKRSPLADKDRKSVSRPGVLQARSESFPRLKTCGGSPCGFRELGSASSTSQEDPFKRAPPSFQRQSNYSKNTPPPNATLGIPLSERMRPLESIIEPRRPYPEPSLWSQWQGISPLEPTRYVDIMYVVERWSYREEGEVGARF